MFISIVILVNLITMALATSVVVYVVLKDRKFLRAVDEFLAGLDEKREERGRHLVELFSFLNVSEQVQEQFVEAIIEHENEFYEQVIDVMVSTHPRDVLLLEDLVRQMLDIYVKNPLFQQKLQDIEKAKKVLEYRKAGKLTKQADSKAANSGSKDDARLLAQTQDYKRKIVMCKKAIKKQQQEIDNIVRVLRVFHDEHAKKLLVNQDDIPRLSLNEMLVNLHNMGR